uniref:Uncharacterized protein n=1 Tax=Fagus sylvatica TaxID=28930 RepID=A0A2N9HJY1_FAGSY
MGIELSPFVRELEFGIWNLPLLFGTWHLAPGTTNGACRYEEYDNVRELELSTSLSALCSRPPSLLSALDLCSLLSTSLSALCSRSLLSALCSRSLLSALEFSTSLSAVPPSRATLCSLLSAVPPSRATALSALCRPAIPSHPAVLSHPKPPLPAPIYFSHGKPPPLRSPSLTDRIGSDQDQILI